MTKPHEETWTTWRSGSTDSRDGTALTADDLTDEQKDALGRELTEVLRPFTEGKFKEHDLCLVNDALAPIAERYGLELEALRRVDDPYAVTIMQLHEVGPALASGRYRRAAGVLP